MRTRALRPIVAAPAAAALVLALLAGSGPAAAEPAQGRISGTVTDSSGAALPGVTVTVVGADPASPLTTVTDGGGHYELDAVPAGTVTIRFELEGFEAGATPLEIGSGQGTRVNCQLAVATLEEAVTVYGLAPLEPPPPPQRPRAPEPLELTERRVSLFLAVSNREPRTTNHGLFLLAERAGFEPAEGC